MKKVICILALFLAALAVLLNVIGVGAAYTKPTKVLQTFTAGSRKLQGTLEKFMQPIRNMYGTDFAGRYNLAYKSSLHPGEYLKDSETEPGTPPAFFVMANVPEILNQNMLNRRADVVYICFDTDGVQTAAYYGTYIREKTLFSSAVCRYTSQEHPLLATLKDDDGQIHKYYLDSASLDITRGYIIINYYEEGAETDIKTSQARFTWAKE